MGYIYTNAVTSDLVVGYWLKAGKILVITLQTDEIRRINFSTNQPVN